MEPITEAAEETEGSGATRSWLAFPLDPPLVEEIEAVVALVREAPEPRRHGERVLRLVQVLTDEGLEAFYLRSVERIGVNLVTRSSLKLALAAASRTVQPIMRRIVLGLGDDQLRRLVDVLEGFLIEEAPREEPEAAEGSAADGG